MKEVDQELARTLDTLRRTISVRGFTQVEIQRRLGWGRSSVSDYLAGQAALRLESLLLILQAIDVSRGEFYGELYSWPPLEESAHKLPELDPTEEVDRVLAGLSERMRRRGKTQVAVERRLGWGRDYIRHLMRKQKRLRVKQVLSILAALEIDAGEFHRGLYRRASSEKKVLRQGKAEPRLEVMVEILAGAVAELSRTLVRKGLLNDRDLPALFRGGEADEDLPPPPGTSSASER